LIGTEIKLAVIRMYLRLRLSGKYAYNKLVKM
jgi:hypothetical protein